MIACCAESECIAGPSLGPLKQPTIGSTGNKAKKVLPVYGTKEKQEMLCTKLVANALKDPFTSKDL